MDPRKLFRKAALEKLSSPERLDVMMQVTSPFGWLALIALGLTIFALIVWSIVGTIPLKVQGQGILMRGKEVLAVTSGADGRITEIVVEAGDNVRVGQVVAKLAQPDLMLRIQHTRQELRELQGQSANQSSNQAVIINRLQRQKIDLQERLVKQQEAVDKGLIPRSRLLQTQSEITNIEKQIAQTGVTDAGRSNRIAAVRRELNELESRLDSSVDVRSEYDGRVLELSATPGDLVGPGMRIVTLESFDEPIEAVMYIPAKDGKKVLQGMEVLVSPTTVKAEEYGFIKGEVRDVSDYPVSSQALIRVLRDQNLVEELTGGSAPIEVLVDLIEDPETPSGFKWSSSVGPPNKVFSGTLVSGTVSVEKKKPISYVIPMIRKAMGTSS
jgi:HlyD family secretion protein